MDVRERRNKGKRRKGTIPLSHISLLVSAAAKEARRRILSLSPTTPQLMTSCPPLITKVNPNRTRGDDEIVA
ncbi:hypothetical protein BLNAU_12045 [Blattamonas nauphoetae]|uniref:Uncharacterized protein n=1 Tax=Blattamonas nauphoetae TaxID=2049346 RepID=A0ABQ9XLY1_9EUKA|nr:hypothetical protein BLNAU_12045 [Blattamonas nauphoetae]